MTQTTEDAQATARATVPLGPRIPLATYRVQLNRGFGFEAAARIADYVDRLGASDLYASPLLAANPGSPHGYDIVDHRRLSPELGGDAGFESLAVALERHGMGLVVDFVPNHMGVDQPRANPWWWDVLENGPVSPYARYFDIDWHPVKPELKGKVLLPILGDPYGRLLERGELQLRWDRGTAVLGYFERELPINPRRIPELLEHGLDRLRASLGDDHPDVAELSSILSALSHLPSRVDPTRARARERHREKEIARERLANLVERSPEIRAHVDACIVHFNGTPGSPESFEPLHKLLEGQMYRLAHWRTAFHEINYRRFFDVNGLASLRMENPEVFAAAHGRVLDLIARRVVTGLRLDHVDGLYDPAGYLQRLREATARATSGVDGAPPACSIYVVAEKILMPNESLPDWALAGTTGYDFLNDLNGLFIDAGKRSLLQRVYRRFTHDHHPFEQIVYDGKKAVMRSALASELNVLAHQLNAISERHRHTRDFTLNSLHQMLLEMVACFPVYRTYIAEGRSSDADIRHIEAAVARVKRRNPTMDPSIIQFFVDVMLDRAPERLSRADREKRRTFAMKFQQYSGPVEAKGVEDTAFYRYNVLLSVNEVGGDPSRFGLDAAEFHARNRARREHWPHAMLATSTHDTKRGEDARARLNVLSEIPEEWGKAVSRWARANGPHRTWVADSWVPDRRDEYHFYQALLAVWPRAPVDHEALCARLSDYMLKAVHEAKLHSSWLHENHEYDHAVRRFVEQTLTGPRASRFLESFVPFAQRVARIGMVNSLAQLALKLVVPGVPDFYQGTELWDLSLVDPDNRRPVDFELRARLLASLEPGLDSATPVERREAMLAESMAAWADGRIKLWITAAGLRLRKALPELFLEGYDTPLEAAGARREHVVALARHHGDHAVIAVVPRLGAALTGDAPPLDTAAWGDTRVTLPEALHGFTFEDALTARPIGHDAASAGIFLAEMLKTCPIALVRGRRA